MTSRHSVTHVIGHVIKSPFNVTRDQTRVTSHVTRDLVEFRTPRLRCYRTPFNSEAQFKLADLLYRRAEVSASNIDALLEIWAQSVHEFDTSAPFKSHEDLHTTIDSSILGDVPWQCMVTQVPEDADQGMPSWMRTSYEVWYRDPEVMVSNMLSNPDFDGQFDMCPYIELGANGKRRWSNVMSGNIAWRRSVSRIILASESRTEY